MFPVGLQKYLLLVVLDIVMFNCPQNTVDAFKDTVITACNDTTTCIQTYEEVYKLLGSHKNYFNIAQALYPAKRMTSHLVHVRLHGANGTENYRPANYTWSLSCLFSAFPENVLEVLSLGSILVTSRTQELNVTIAPFCCNVSLEDRMTIIDNALAALQDLAVSPGIQDPNLNTAECVIEGHEPNLKNRGRSTSYIIVTMCFSCIFAVSLGPWLALYTLVYFDNVKPTIPALYSALKGVSFFLLIGELVLVFTAIVFLCQSNAAALLKGLMLSILITVFLEGPIVGVCCFRKDIPNLGNCKSWKLHIVIFMLATLTSYLFCWIVIGIMVNALWSVTVLLFVCVIIIGLFFSLYIFYSYFNDRGNRIINFLFCLTMLLPVGSLVAIVIVGGQTVFGRNTTDDVVKTVILSVSIAFMKRTLSIMKTEDTPEKCEKKEEKESKGKNEGGKNEASIELMSHDTNG